MKLLKLIHRGLIFVVAFSLSSCSYQSSLEAATACREWVKNSPNRIEFSTSFKNELLSYGEMRFNYRSNLRCNHEPETRQYVGMRNMRRTEDMVGKAFPEAEEYDPDNWPRWSAADYEIVKRFKY